MIKKIVILSKMIKSEQNFKENIFFGFRGFKTKWFFKNVHFCQTKMYIFEKPYGIKAVKTMEITAAWICFGFRCFKTKWFFKIARPKKERCGD